jgi:iron(III) transport system ATP-binding protein
MYALDIQGIAKAFNGTPAVREATLKVRPGQVTALLGPSGCGKTTLLRLVAGFEWPDSGAVRINGRVVAGDGQMIAPEARRVGMVFQEYALFPHLSVQDNIAFGLRGASAEKRARVEEMLTLVGLSSLGERLPHELSGGQQQRVALARALAPRPDLLLLDEPFSNLDAALRAQVRGEVRAILKSAGTTVVFVTHDQEEALSQSDEVAVMFDGRVVQVAPPQQLYLDPINRRVAAFVGEANFLPGEARGDVVECALGVLPITSPALGKVEVLIRPETLHLTPVNSEEGIGTEAPDAGRVKPRANAHAIIRWQEFYGHDQRVGLTLPDGTPLTTRLDARLRFQVGAAVTLSVTAPVPVFSLP